MDRANKTVAADQRPSGGRCHWSADAVAAAVIAGRDRKACRAWVAVDNRNQQANRPVADENERESPVGQVSNPASSWHSDCRLCLLQPPVDIFCDVHCIRINVNRKVINYHRQRQSSVYST